MNNRALRAYCIITFAALMIALLLTGCAQDFPDTAVKENQSIDFTGLEDSQTLHLQLYFLSSRGFYLTTEMRTIQVKQGTSWAEAAVGELLRGPENADSKRCLPEGTTIEKVVVSNRLANVYLGGAFNNLPLKDELTARAALINTLCSIQDIKYVGIYGGRHYLALSAPAAVSRYTGTLDELLNTLKERQDTDGTDTAEWIDLPLYFMDTRGLMLLPEVRNCRASYSNLANVILQELMKGPSDTVTYKPVLSPSAPPVADAVVSEHGGIKTVTINLSAVPYRDLFVVKGHETLPYAAIVYSITSCMPDVDAVVFEINGKRVTQIGKTDIGRDGRMTRQMFADYEGRSITLYFPDENMDALLPVKRALRGQDAGLGIEWMRDLVIGPLEREDDRAWPIVPSGITGEDILGVKFDNDLAIVNLSKHFADVCKNKNLSLKEESALVYSIVNTMTETPGIKRVQFLVEGSAVNTLGSAINVLGPIMRNVGIIDSSRQEQQ